MSQSPNDARAPRERYLAGWAAINALVRRGYSWSGNERNVVFLNTGQERFADVSAVSGLDFLDDARAAALLDWDGDGRQDMLVSNRTAPGLRLLRNRIESGHAFLSLSLEGGEGLAGEGSQATRSNRDAIGARVEVLLGGATPRKLVATKRVGSGYLAQSSGRLHFGLGSDPELQTVLVRWPSGGTQLYSDLEPNRHYRLTEGQPPRLWEPHAGFAATASGSEAHVNQEPGSTAEPERASRQARVVLPRPVVMPSLLLDTDEGQRERFFGLAGDGESGTGRPILLNLWASWCLPCLRELEEFTEHERELKRAQIDVLALSVDEAADRDKAIDFLRKVEWPYWGGFAAAEAIDVLDAFQGVVLNRETRIPVPTSFLLDGEARVIAIYFGRVAVEQVLADLKLIEVDADERRRAASPFEGRWHHPASDQADLGLYERRFDRRGLAGTAREFHLGRTQTRSLTQAEFHHRFARTQADRGQLGLAIEHLVKAVELDPQFFDAQSDLAVALHKSRRMPEAITAYLRALEIRPEHDQTLMNLGAAYLAHRQPDRADEIVARLQRLKSPLAQRLGSFVQQYRARPPR